MRCRELMEHFEYLAPAGCACDWDNPGLLAGRGEKEIRKVLVALDATDEVVEQAVREQADLVLTHHPLIFKAMKKINDSDFIGRRLLTLIRQDICCFAMHTNFDAAPGCMADLAVRQLGMVPEAPLELTGEVRGIPAGIGKVGTLPEPMDVETLASLVRERFGLPFVTVYGTREVQEKVSRIAISPGAGGSMIRPALESRAQVLITGDIGHHDGIDAAARHMAVIDAGHYGIEHIFIPFMKEFLEQLPGAGLEVVTAAPAFPARVIV